MVLQGCQALQPHGRFCLSAEQDHSGALPVRRVKIIIYAYRPRRPANPTGTSGNSSLGSEPVTVAATVPTSSFQ